MITREDLLRGLRFNTQRAKAAVEGLTHEDALLQPPVPGNCMNWVLGHIVDNRDTVLEQLGQPPLMGEQQRKRYGYGSEPVCADGEDVIKLEELLRMLQSSQETIAAVLGRITAEDLAKEVKSFYGNTSLGSFLFFLCWHETYHLGQTEILRQLAGTNDKVI